MRVSLTNPSLKVGSRTINNRKKSTGTLEGLGIYKTRGGI